MIKFIYYKIILRSYIVLLNFISFLKSNKKENKLVSVCDNYNFSTTSRIIFWNNIDILNKIKKNNVEGDFVECGVYKGITLVFFQKYIEMHKLKNIKIYAFDTFEGIPEPSEEDFDIYGNSMKAQVETLKIDKDNSSWNNASLEEVQSNYFKNTEFNKNLNLIKGKVEDTLLKNYNIPEKISLLKLDTCLYEGTKIELEVLFSKVQIGGAVIVENYFNFLGVKKAVDEFFSSRKHKITYNKITSRAVIYL